MILLLVGIALTVLMCCITKQLAGYLPPDRYRQTMTLLIPAYLLINGLFTLFTRTQGDYPVIFVPLHVYIQALGWDCRTFSDVYKLLSGGWEEAAAPTLLPLVSAAQNIVLFLPFGFLLTGACGSDTIIAPSSAGCDAGRNAAAHGLSTTVILLLGCLLSAVIEFTQLFLKLGWFEADDILHNTLGTYAGVRVYRRLMKAPVRKEGRM